MSGSQCMQTSTPPFVVDERETQPVDSQPMSQLCDVKEEPWGLLVCLRNDSTIALKEDEFKVGRSPENDYVLNESTLPQVSKHISREHFRIYRTQTKNEQYLVSIKDASSTGTFVNGNLVGNGRSRILSDKDKISVSKSEHVVFVFHDLQYEKKIPGFPTEVIKNYTLIDDIGKGGFGKVYLVVKHSTKEKLAMKAVKLNVCSQNESPLNEPNIMYKIRHPNIVRVFDTVVTGGDFFIFMEFMEGGDLFHYLEQRPTNVPESQAKFICYQLLMALCALHEQKIVHRDIKPLNILLQSRQEFPVVKLTDFGLSKILNRSLEPVNTLCGTRLFAAPELNPLFYSKGSSKKYPVYDNRCDIWSLGLVFYFCLSKRLPFEDKSGLPSVEFRVRKSMFDFEPVDTWLSISSGAKNIIRSMIRHDYKDRPSSKELLQTAYFNDSNVRRRYSVLVSGYEGYGDENNPNT